jgi:hypothetical protein
MPSLLYSEGGRSRFTPNVGTHLPTGMTSQVGRCEPSSSDRESQRKPTDTPHGEVLCSIW